jgi:hypothetical protein
VTDLSQYWVETVGDHIDHYNVDRDDRKGIDIISHFYYPNACSTLSYALI